MATFEDPFSNEYSICPYDESHIIKNNRLPYHIVKCAKNYPNAQLMQCPYNAAHRVINTQYEKHIEQCAQTVQLSMRADVAKTSEEAKRRVDVLENEECITVTDDWDDSITAFTVEANESEDVTKELNLDRIGFSQTQVSQKDGDVAEESAKSNALCSFGIGRGNVFKSSSNEKFSRKGIGRGRVQRIDSPQDTDKE